MNSTSQTIKISENQAFGPFMVSPDSPDAKSAATKIQHTQTISEIFATSIEALKKMQAERQESGFGWSCCTSPPRRCCLGIIPSLENIFEKFKDGSSQMSPESLDTCIKDLELLSLSRMDETETARKSLSNLIFCIKKYSMQIHSESQNSPILKRQLHDIHSQSVGNTENLAILSGVLQTSIPQNSPEEERPLPEENKQDFASRPEQIFVQSKDLTSTKQENDSFFVTQLQANITRGVEIPSLPSAEEFLKPPECLRTLTPREPPKAELSNLSENNQKPSAQPERAFSEPEHHSTVAIKKDGILTEIISVGDNTARPLDHSRTLNPEHIPELAAFSDDESGLLSDNDDDSFLEPEEIFKKRLRGPDEGMHSRTTTATKYRHSNTSSSAVRSSNVNILRGTNPELE